MCKAAARFLRTELIRPFSRTVGVEESTSIKSLSFCPTTVPKSSVAITIASGSSFRARQTRVEAGAIARSSTPIVDRRTATECVRTLLQHTDRRLGKPNIDTGGEFKFRLTELVRFAHAALMGTQACRNMVARGEPIGVAVLVIIGAVLIALAPSKQLPESALRSNQLHLH